MKKNVRKIIAVLLGLLGTILAIYIGGYWLFIRPVRYLYVGFLAGTLTKKSLIICIIKIFWSSTAGGGIWCAFDIFAGHFRDE